MLATIAQVTNNEDQCEKKTHSGTSKSTNQDGSEPSITLYLQIADLVAHEPMHNTMRETGIVVPERIGLLTQRRIPDSMPFKLYPDDLEVDVCIS